MLDTGSVDEIIQVKFAIFGKDPQAQLPKAEGSYPLHFVFKSDDLEATALQGLKPSRVIQEHAGLFALEDRFSPEGAVHIGPYGQFIRISSLASRAIESEKSIDPYYHSFSTRKAYCEQISVLILTSDWEKHAPQLLSQSIQWIKQTRSALKADPDSKPRSPRLIVTSASKVATGDMEQDVAGLCNAIATGCRWRIGAIKDAAQGVNKIISALERLPRQHRATARFAVGYLQPMANCDAQLFIGRNLAIGTLTPLQTATMRQHTDAFVKNKGSALTLEDLYAHITTLPDLSTGQMQVALKIMHGAKSFQPNDEQNLIAAFELFDICLSAVFARELEYDLTQIMGLWLLKYVQHKPTLSASLLNKLAALHIAPLVISSLFEGSNREAAGLLAMIFHAAREESKLPIGENMFDRSIRATQNWYSTFWEKRVNEPSFKSHFADFANAQGRSNAKDNAMPASRIYSNDDFQRALESDAADGATVINTSLNR